MGSDARSIEKHFKPKLGSQLDNMFIDRLKPTFLGNSTSCCRRTTTLRASPETSNRTKKSTYRSGAVETNINTTISTQPSVIR